MGGRTPRGCAPGLRYATPRAVFWRPFRALVVGTIGWAGGRHGVALRYTLGCVLAPIQGARYMPPHKKNLTHVSFVLTDVFFYVKIPFKQSKRATLMQCSGRHKTGGIGANSN